MTEPSAVLVPRAATMNGFAAAATADGQRLVTSPVRAIDRQSHVRVH